MKLWKKCLSGILSAAMLVGMLPTSALAVHAPITSAGGQGLAKEASLYINETATDTELEPVENTEAMYLNSLATNSSVYPYTIPITPGQTETEIYAKAGVTMSNTVANSLETAAYELDVERTKFVILMALDENMTLDTNSTFLFNSTFLMPDADQMNQYADQDNAITVTEDTSYQSDYQSDTARDMRWSISGDLDLLYIKNPNDIDAQTSNAGGFEFRDFFSQDYRYIDDNDPTKGSQAGEAVDNEWNDFTGDGEANISNMKFYAIPVKMNWSAIAESADEAREIYGGYTQEDWKCPMELTVAKESGSPYEGVKITIDLENPTSDDAAGQYINRQNRGKFDLAENLPALPTTGIDSFIWTTDDADPFNMFQGRQVMGLVNSMPVAGAIVGSIWRLNDVIMHAAEIIHPGHIYIQFAYATPGTIKVTKTIEGLPADAEMPDSLAVTITDQNGNPARDLNGNVVTASIDKGNWTYDEETGNWTATIQVEGLRPYDETYGWDYQYNVAVAEESGFEGYSRDGGISISDNTELTLENQYELTRNEDGTVNYEEKNDATVPEVKVTSKYTTETPPVEQVTLTYDGNGGTGEAPAEQTVDQGSNVTIAANTFSRDGYTFTGWNTQADGTGTAYAAGETISLSEDTTLYAQWAEIVDWNGSEVGKTATNLDINYQSDVTLSLPAAGYQKEVDVVFAIDCSSVLENNAGKMANALYQMAQELLEKEHILLNIGVVGYGHNADVLAELQPVNAENADDFLAALTAAFENSLTDDSQIDHDGGSNVQVGIRVAKNLLDSSTTGTTANNRHLILMTDGAGFYYCRSDEDSTSVSTVHNGDKKQAMGNMDATTDVGGAKKNTGELYGKVDRTKDSKYQQLVTEGKNFGNFIAEQGDEIKESAINSFSKSEAATVSNEQSYTTAQVQDFDTYPYINMDI